MNKQQRIVISFTYRVRFSAPRIDKQFGRGGKEVSRTWSVYKEGAANELVATIRQQKLDIYGTEPGYYPSKWVQGSKPRVGAWTPGPRFDEPWQALEWAL